MSSKKLFWFIDRYSLWIDECNKLPKIHPKVKKIRKCSIELPVPTTKIMNFLYKWHKINQTKTESCGTFIFSQVAWRRHDMEIPSALLAFCEGIHLSRKWFRSQRVSYVDLVFSSLSAVEQTIAALSVIGDDLAFMRRQYSGSTSSPCLSLCVCVCVSMSACVRACVRVFVRT